MDYLDENSGIIGLIFFMTFYFAVVLMLIRPGAKEYYQKQSKIPLAEEHDE